MTPLLQTSRDALAWLEDRGTLAPVVEHAVVNAWRPALALWLAGVSPMRAMIGGLVAEATLRSFVILEVNRQRSSPPPPVDGLTPMLPSSAIAAGYVEGRRPVIDVMAGAAGRAAMLLPPYLMMGIPPQKAVAAAAAGSALIEFSVLDFVRQELDQ